MNVRNGANDLCDIVNLTVREKNLYIASNVLMKCKKTYLIFFEVCLWPLCIAFYAIKHATATLDLGIM